MNELIEIVKSFFSLYKKETCLKRYSETTSIVLTSNGSINLDRIDNVIGISFANSGATNATIYNYYTIPPTPPGNVIPIISDTESFRNMYKRDNINVTFAGGTGTLIVFITKEVLIS